MKDLREHREPKVGLPEILKSAGYVAGAGVAATVGGVVALSTSGCRCGSGSSSSSSNNDFNYEAWAETDGAAGRINMEAVQQAFETANDPSQFELLVNEIYEGEQPILIRVHNVGTNQQVEGWEDLNGDGQIVATQDDQMFTLTRPLSGQGQTTLQGHGANSYYTHRYPPGYSFGGGFFTGYLMGSLMMRPYYTPIGRRSVIMSHRSTYRGSAAYRTRQASNRAFSSRMRASNPAYSTSRGSASRTNFRNSVRSSGGSFGRTSGGRSGFRGGAR